MMMMVVMMMMMLMMVLGADRRDEDNGAGTFDCEGAKARMLLPHMVSSVEKMKSCCWWCRTSDDYSIVNTGTLLLTITFESTCSVGSVQTESL